MTTWNNSDFNYHGGYLTYDMKDGHRDHFIARFEYGAGLVTMGMFKKALRASGLTPDAYIELLSDNANTPIGILEANGALKIDHTFNLMTHRITKTEVYIAGKLVKTL